MTCSCLSFLVVNKNADRILTRAVRNVDYESTQTIIGGQTPLEATSQDCGVNITAAERHHHFFACQ